MSGIKKYGKYLACSPGGGLVRNKRVFGEVFTEKSIWMVPQVFTVIINHIGLGSEENQPSGGAPVRTGGSGYSAVPLMCCISPHGGTSPVALLLLTLLS